MKKIFIPLFIYGCSYGQNNLQKINSGFLESKNNSINIGLIYVELSNKIILTEEKSLDKEIIVQKKINIYPNPSSSVFNFETNENIINERVYLYDINGKLVTSQNIQSNSIDLSNLSNGIYLLRFENRNYNELKITKN